MGSLIAFIGSGVTVIAGLIAVLLVHGGWEAVAMGITMLAAFTFMGSVAVLAAEGDHMMPWR